MNKTDEDAVKPDIPHEWRSEQVLAILSGNAWDIFVCFKAHAEHGHCRPKAFRNRCTILAIDQLCIALNPLRICTLAENSKICCLKSERGADLLGGFQM